MRKMTFSELDVALDRIYEKSFETLLGAPEKDIAEFCEYVRAFVEGQGWTVEDYIAQLALPDEVRNAN